MVKKDLTVLVALVQLQQRAIQDETARAALAETAHRIQVLARVQDRLQRSDEITVVNTRSFIDALCED
ncbi:histidine kinase dimerization/phosphoacceptor domain -containing protein [Methylobacterium nigriterrae]|uniref:histidine kinase dimerization/phosphoacceptor domain -containing protein n=1 Tax=Methylobacterium nigriterrae TaxID=3127512 RepID=UPI0030137023